MADTERINIAPLRSLDDFLINSARFQVPTMNDLMRWNNRVVQNLMYYQTNYFLTYVIVLSLISILHPSEMFCGLSAVGVAGGIFFYLTNNKVEVNEFKKNHPLLSVIFILLCGYFIVYLLGSVIVFAFGVLLPLLVIFMHASMRLRNIKNKIANKVEWIGLKRSPMGIFLEYFGLEPEKISY